MEERSQYLAANFIIEQAELYPGELVIVCAGALTNLARAIQLNPGIISQIKHVVYMGMGCRMDSTVKTKWKTEYFPIPDNNIPIENRGVVYPYFPNHNISADTAAAMKVFLSGIKISVVNHDVTSKNWWEREETQKLLQCSNGTEELGEMRVVGLLLDEWFRYRSSIFFTDIKGTCPHDALAVLEAIFPEKYVSYARGYLIIHEWAGFSSFIYDPLGPHRIGVKISEENSKKFLDDFSSYLFTPKEGTGQ